MFRGEPLFPGVSLAHTSQASPSGFGHPVPCWGQWAGKKAWCPETGGSRDPGNARLRGLTWSIPAHELGNLAWLANLSELQCPLP